MGTQCRHSIQLLFCQRSNLMLNDTRWVDVVRASLSHDGICAADDVALSNPLLQLGAQTVRNQHSSAASLDGNEMEGFILRGKIKVSG